MRLVGHDARCGGIGVLVPRPFELGAVALRAVAIHELAVAPDARLDEILRRLLENRAAFLGIGAQQRVAAPALQLGGELPAEIDHVVEAVVETVGAVRRMRMRGVAGNENAAGLVVLRHRDTQIPEPDIVEVAGEGKARGLLQQAVKIVIIPRGIGRHRRMKEPALA